MYSKEDVIHRIGEERWEDFDTFMLGREVGYDEAGLELYYPNDIVAFLQEYGSGPQRDSVV